MPRCRYKQLLYLPILTPRILGHFAIGFEEFCCLSKTVCYDLRPMQSYTTDAIILKRFNLGEADRVLTLLTRDRGRVAAIGRGIRRTKSRLGGHLELFAHTNLTLREGRTFDAITSADLQEPHTGLSTHVERVNAAHYVAEAVLKLTIEEQEVDRLFELVAATFAALARSTEAAGILAGFQLKLLTLLGHQPVLERCVHCTEKFQDLTLIIHNSLLITREVAGFDTVHGGLVCRDCLAGLQHPVVDCDVAGQTCLRSLLLEPLAETRATDAGFRTAIRVIEQALLHQTERPLKSRAFVELSPVAVHVA